MANARCQRPKLDEQLLLMYRQYATLYIIFIVDNGENELAILDLIQVFVEAMDRCFNAVCELDLIFNMHKIHYILNEIIVGGMVIETNLDDILSRYKEQCKLENESVCQYFFLFKILCTDGVERILCKKKQTKLFGSRNKKIANNFIYIV